MCAYGKTLGVRITLETFDQKVDNNALVGPANETASLAQVIRIENPNYGILFDRVHMPSLDESPPSALGELKACLVHAHVGNCVKVSGRTAFGDRHPRFGFPGSENDVIQLVEFLRALYEVGYLRENMATGSLQWIGFEIRPQADEEVAVILEKLSARGVRHGGRLNLLQSSILLAANICLPTNLKQVCQSYRCNRLMERQCGSAVVQLLLAAASARMLLAG